MKTTIKVSEHQLQTLLKNYLEAKGWFVMRLNSGMIRDSKGHGIRLSPAGTPDLMAFRESLDFESKDTQLIFIEVKTPHNPNPTFSQDQKMMELEEHGAKCLVIHSLEELEDALS